MKRVVILLCLLNVSLLFSQSKIDSLVQVVATTNNDSIKTIMYLKLYYEYHRIDQNIALSYTNKAEELAEKAGLKLTLGKSKMRKGSALRNLGLYDQAKEKYNEALSIFLKFEDTLNIIYVKIDLASALQVKKKIKNNQGNSAWAET